MGYEQRNHADTELVRQLTEFAKLELVFEKQQEASRKLAQETIEKIKAYNKIYYDKQYKKLSMILVTT